MMSTLATLAGAIVLIGCATRAPSQGVAAPGPEATPTESKNDRREARSPRENTGK